MLPRVHQPSVYWRRANVWDQAQVQELLERNAPGLLVCFVLCVTSCKEILWNGWLRFLPHSRQHLCTGAPAPTSFHLYWPPPLFFFLCSLPSLLPSPLRLDTDGIDLLMSFLKVSLPKSSGHECDVKIWRDTCRSYVWTVWFGRKSQWYGSSRLKFNVLKWLFMSRLLSPSRMSVRVEKEDLRRWSNEAAVLQEPWATGAHAAREWVMKWQRSKADLADKARYNFRGSSSEDQSPPRCRDAALPASCAVFFFFFFPVALTDWLPSPVCQTCLYSHWRRSSCRGILATGTHRTRSQVRSDARRRCETVTLWPCEAEMMLFTSVLVN